MPTLFPLQDSSNLSTRLTPLTSLTWMGVCCLSFVIIGHFFFCVVHLKMQILVLSPQLCTPIIEIRECLLRTYYETFLPHLVGATKLRLVSTMAALSTITLETEIAFPTTQHCSSGLVGGWLGQVRYCLRRKYSSRPITCACCCAI